MTTTHEPYRETRRHELRKTRLLMIDGSLVANSRSAEGSVSERVYEGGVWGFAAAPLRGDGAATKVREQALRNARAMARFGSPGGSSAPLPGGAHRGRHRHAGRPMLTPAECVERLQALHAFCAARYPSLRSAQFMLMDEDHTKQLETSSGSDVTHSIQRAACYLTLTIDGEDGSPVELSERIAAKGSLADLALSPEALTPLLDATWEHLQAKRHGVPARGGQHTVVLAAELAGILAHEAMGHPCEADLVLGGAITGSLVGQSVASELITMVDYAHTFRGEETMVPVYADDEGTPARDAVLIDRGVLVEFMNSRETALQTGREPTGNARAYLPVDEPLVRMRNTAILPGEAKLAAMIEGVDDGYLLMKTGNGQADSTTEFMFAVTLGYEIKNGRVGAAIRDTTVSGSAIKVLQSVDAVSDDMVWNCAGYCGKKQPMVVSMGGPAIRTRAHLGGV